LAKASLGITQTRQDIHTSGRGKIKTQEEITTQVTGIQDLTSYQGYQDPEKIKRESKQSEGNPINAVVVQTYQNEDIPADKCPVFLTNGNVDDPFVIYDEYDNRSLIENLLFREGKQGWDLEHAPTRKANGMTSH